MFFGELHARVSLCFLLPFSIIIFYVQLDIIFRSRDWSKYYSENGNLATNYVFVSLGVLRLYLGCPPSVPWFVLRGSSRFVLLVVLMHVLLDVN